jgi:hypothetical protein
MSRKSSPRRSCLAAKLDAKRWPNLPSRLIGHQRRDPGRPDPRSNKAREARFWALEAPKLLKRAMRAETSLDTAQESITTSLTPPLPTALDAEVLIAARQNSAPIAAAACRDFRARLVLATLAARTDDCRVSGSTTAAGRRTIARTHALSLADGGTACTGSAPPVECRAGAARSCSIPSEHVGGQAKPGCGIIKRRECARDSLTLARLEGFDLIRHDLMDHEQSAPPLFKAAQYLRISTGNQRYSLAHCSQGAHSASQHRQ